MSTTNVVNKWLAMGAGLAHRASLKWLHIGKWLLGFVLFLAIFLEGLVAYDTAEMMLIDHRGNLPESAWFWATLTALVFCLVMLALFHLPVGLLRKSITSRMLVWLLIVASIVTLSQPIISLLSELRFGNSLEGGANAGLLLKQQLIAAGYAVRALVILGAAFVASWGVHMMIEAKQGVSDANRDAQDANEMYEAITEADRLHRTAVASRERALSFNWDRSEEFSAAVAGGFGEMANAVARYLKGPDDPFIDPEQLMQDVIAQFNEPVASLDDPKVAQMVDTRLRKHAIDLTLLPSSSAQLSKAARKQLAHYGDWLRGHADVDAIHKATRYEMGVPNA